MNYGPARKPAIERFMDLVQITPDDHWIWIGGRTDKGYGIFRDENVRSVRAHRWSYQFFNGPLTPDDVVRHKCDRPWCVNPDCLINGTQTQNQQDMLSRGRLGKRSNQARTNGQQGLKPGREPMTSEKVKSIQADYATGLYSQNQLAAKYKASQTIISRVVRGKYDNLS